MVTAETIYKVPVKCISIYKVGYYTSKVFLVVRIEDMVYKLNDDFGYLIIKNYGRMFKYHVHVFWIL